MMRGGSRVWVFLLFSIVEVMSWVSLAAGRHFPHVGQAQFPVSFHVKWEAATKREELVNGDDGMRRVGMLGSRPPSCEHKCGECAPCGAIQVPTTTNQFRIEYSNYEPEGWKCKCGSSFFNP